MLSIQRKACQTIFFFIGRMTPLNNVDLLLKCSKNGTLLTWREDKITGNGWHIPSGIISFKEKIGKRISEVGKSELGILIKNFNGPIAVNENYNKFETKIAFHILVI